MDIVLVTASCMRHDYVSTPDGGVDPSLPALSGFAEGATSFTRSYASSPNDESTLRATLAGSHPTNTSARTPTLVDVLSQAGWRTKLIGGSAGRSLVDAGFETPDIEPDQGPISRIRRAVGSEIAAETTVGRSIEPIDRLLGTTVGVRVAARDTHDGESVTERALSWLEETAGPRFLWVHYDDAGAPHVPREGTVSESVNPRVATRLANVGATAPESLTASEEETLEQLYRGELEHLDRCLDRLFEGIYARLDATETTVAVAGTSGCPLGERGAWYDAPEAFYDESVRVPLFVRGPDFEAETAEFGTSSVDVLTTLLATAGIDRTERRGGSDLRTFTGRRVTERQVFAADDAPTEAMICNGRWKLSRSLQDGRETLFDRAEDPEERRDRSSENLPVQRALTHALDCFVEARRNQRADVRNRPMTVTSAGD